MFQNGRMTSCERMAGILNTKIGRLLNWSDARRPAASCLGRPIRGGLSRQEVRRKYHDGAGVQASVKSSQLLSVSNLALEIRHTS